MDFRASGRSRSDGTARPCVHRERPQLGVGSRKAARTVSPPHQRAAVEGERVMCGIVGLLSAAGMAATIGRTFVQDTLQLQHTRGPDDRGTVDIGLGNFTLTLGHNRLSVIDLSVAGHQPMTDRSSAYTITYNGEIYNYIELKRELEDLGAQFGTRTDTEVILE